MEVAGLEMLQQSRAHLHRTSVHKKVAMTDVKSKEKSKATTSLSLQCIKIALLRFKKCSHRTYRSRSRLSLSVPRGKLHEASSGRDAYPSSSACGKSSSGRCAWGTCRRQHCKGRKVHIEQHLSSP